MTSWFYFNLYFHFTSKETTSDSNLNKKGWIKLGQNYIQVVIVVMCHVTSYYDVINQNQSQNRNKDSLMLMVFERQVSPGPISGPIQGPGWEEGPSLLSVTVRRALISLQFLILMQIKFSLHHSMLQLFSLQFVWHWMQQELKRMSHYHTLRKVLRLTTMRYKISLCTGLHEQYAQLLTSNWWRWIIQNKVTTATLDAP